MNYENIKNRFAKRQFIKMCTYAVSYCKQKFHHERNLLLHYNCSQVAENKLITNHGTYTDDKLNGEQKTNLVDLQASHLIQLCEENLIPCVQEKQNIDTNECILKEISINILDLDSISKEKKLGPREETKNGKNVATGAGIPDEIQKSLDKTLVIRLERLDVGENNLKSSIGNKLTTVSLTQNKKTEQKVLVIDLEKIDLESLFKETNKCQLVHKGFTCYVCHAPFRRKHLLDNHAQLHDNDKEKKYSCAYCKKKFQHEKNLLLHETFSLCPKDMVKENTFKKEKISLRPVNVNSFFDGINLKLFNNQWILKKKSHIPKSRKNVNKEKNRNKIYKVRNNLGGKKLHIIPSHKSQKITKERSLMVVVQKLHPNNLFKVNPSYDIPIQTELTCSICNITFHKKDTLKTHYNMHNSDNIKYECSICYQWFFWKDTISHFRLHNKYFENYYRCRRCHKTYICKSSMDAHFCESNTVAKKKYECFLCRKKFHSKSSLPRHSCLNNKTVESKYECSVCHKCFYWEHSLAKHIQLHTEYLRNKFKCPRCPKIFFRKFSLRKHIRMHKTNARKSYKCSLCRKKYHYKKSMLTHLSLHKKL